MGSNSESQKNNPVGHFINSISSYDTNVMLAAVISLLLVVLFVLLLHVYAKWFLAKDRHRRRSSSESVSHVLRPSGFHHFHAFTFDTTLSSSSSSSSPPSNGLDPSLISSIPLFVYRGEDCKQGLECVICLSAFEENEVGRNLKKCGHVFHVECIDMWLHSHSNCPICRAPAVIKNDPPNEEVKSMDATTDQVDLRDGESSLEVVIDIPNSENENSSSSPSSSSSSSSSSSRGCSLKRMLSRNKSERKVFPSNDVNELDA